MMTNLDAGSELFLANVNRIQQGLAVANQQVSSGKKISVASDAPDQVSALLQMRSDLQHNSQIQSNLTLAKADASTADSVLGSAISLMDQAMSLGEQGANTTQTSDIRQSLAQQIQGIQEQMVAYSSTTVQNRYIFGGDQMSSPSYTFDATKLSTNPVVQLSSSSPTYQIEDPAGGSFAAAKGATEIFNAPGSANVFNALNTLRQALLANDPTAVGNAIDPLKQASTHLNSMEAFYGQVETRIQSASDYSTSRDTQLQTQIGQTEDADVAAAALQLTQGSTQLQAALQMRARLPHSSLFDFLA